MRQPKKTTSPARGRDNIVKFDIKTDGTLLEAARAALPDHTATKVKSLLKHHQFAVDGMPSSQFDRPVRAGDVLEVNFTRSFEVFSHPRIRMVYEDNDIMVVDKGYGLLSTASGKERDETVYGVLRRYVRRRNEHARVYVVHRLDRDTSGLMLLARNAKAREMLVKQWKDLVGQRSYVAVVEGQMEHKHGEVRNYLADDENNYEVYVTDNPKEGQLAVTRYVTRYVGTRYSLVELEMRTGRKNQIRVHMKSLGHPVSGDRKYGGHPNRIKRLALHATLLRLTHPITGKQLVFESPIPEGFELMVK